MIGTIKFLQEHHFSEGTLGIGCIVEGIEYLCYGIRGTFFSATICFSLRSTAFHTIPYAPFPSFSTISYFFRMWGSISYVIYIVYDYIYYTTPVQIFIPPFMEH